MLLIASAWSLVALVALVIVVMFVFSVTVVLDYDAGVVFCVLAGDHTREGLVELVLLLFYGVDEGLSFRLSFDWFWKGFFRGLLHLHLVNLLIVYPVSSILHFTILEKLTEAMSIVILKVSCVGKTILVIDFTVTAFLIVFVLSSILYLCFAFLEVALAMP
jgi:hypothetical protein